MSVASVVLPDGQRMKLGRRRPTPGRKMLRLSNYFERGLPAPPATYDYTSPSLQSLKMVYLNDQLGDCVIAGGAHIRGVTSGNAGSEVLFTSNDIIKMYSAVGGYIPGHPSTDNGCDEHTALDYWMQVGFTDGVKSAGWLAVDATSRVEVELALWLFENLFFGIELPDEWINQEMPSGNGFIWDVAGHPNPMNGHCITGYGYNSKGIIIETWGMVGLLTWAALVKYCVPRAGGELYTMLLPDMVVKAKGLAPNGFDWVDLVDDFNTMKGGTPVPDPTPPPVPVPSAWQEFINWVESMLVQYGSLAVPMLEKIIAMLPLPPVVIQMIDALLEKYLGVACKKPRYKVAV